MITVKEIEKRIIAKHRDEIVRLEKLIDVELETKWEAGERKIAVKLPKIPREVIDHIAQMYRGPGKWNVGLSSSTNSTLYDTLTFELYQEPRYSGGRD